MDQSQSPPANSQAQSLIPRAAQGVRQSPQRSERRHCY
ncbi:Uncharacterised protein [Vibrio cholerae]|nr:Uncharacterised protein [Vibrio cholerae]